MPVTATRHTEPRHEFAGRWGARTLVKTQWSIHDQRVPNNRNLNRDLTSTRCDLGNSFYCIELHTESSSAVRVQNRTLDGSYDMTLNDNSAIENELYACGRPRRRAPPAAGSSPYSSILRYSVPRLMSSTLAASSLFQSVASSTRMMCARSASRNEGRRVEPSSGRGIA